MKVYVYTDGVYTRDIRDIPVRMRGDCMHVPVITCTLRITRDTNDIHVILMNQ